MEFLSTTEYAELRKQESYNVPKRLNSFATIDTYGMWEEMNLEMEQRVEFYTNGREMRNVINFWNKWNLNEKITSTLEKKTMKKFFSARQGYQAFGSFHTPSLKELFDSSSMNEKKFCLDNLTGWEVKNPKFGKDFGSKYFALSKDWTFINHGAFGACTKRNLEFSSEIRSYSETQPLKFYDRELFPLIVRSIITLGDFIGIKDLNNSLMLIPNATFGLNSVIHSMHQTNKTMICFDVAYGAVKKMLKNQGKFEILNTPANGSSEEILNILEKRFKKRNDDIGLLVIDHVTSNQALIFPIKEISLLCRQYNVKLLVDGAHSLLNLHLNHDLLSNIDFFVGNCHKWLSTPKGCGFLYVNKGNFVHPCIVSHGFEDGMSSAFMWDGLRDYSPQVVLADTIHQWNLLGIDLVRNYMHDLAEQAALYLKTRWSSSILFQEENIQRCSMKLIEIPSTETNRQKDSTDAKMLQDFLHYQHKIEVPIKCIQGKLYVRISAHVYNDMSDYEKLGDAIIKAMV